MSDETTKAAPKSKLHFWISPDGTQVQSFRKESDARARVAEVPESFYANDTPASLAELPLTLLVCLHNIIRPEKTVKKFKDRETAVARMAGVLDALATPGTPSIPPAASQVAGSISPADGTAPPAAAAPKKDKAGKLAGMTIIRRTRTNPRKTGTSGGRSWALITEGMTVEEFLKAGGVRRDLEWDIEHKWTMVVPTAGYAPGVEEAARVIYDAEQAAAAAAAAAAKPAPAPTPAPATQPATEPAAPTVGAQAEVVPPVPEAATA